MLISTLKPKVEGVEHILYALHNMGCITTVLNKFHQCKLSTDLIKKHYSYIHIEF